jgi:hypothetical protein
MLEKELMANWDRVFYGELVPEQTFGGEVELNEPATMPPSQRPGDVLVAEVGSRGLPEQAFTGRYPDTITAVDPTIREKIASFLQSGFEGAGMDRYQARKQAQTLMGGESSNLPLNLGLADILAALFPPATAAMTPLYVQEGARAVERGVEAAQQGRPGEAALEVAAGAADVVPGVAGAAKAVKKVARKAKTSTMPQPSQEPK